MRNRRAIRFELWRTHRLAWALVALVFAANASAVVLGVLDRGVQSLVATAMFTIATTLFVVVGAVIVTWQRGNAVGWLFIVLATFLSVAHNLSQNYAVYALTASPGSLPFGTAALFLASSAFDATFVLTTVLVLQLFPDGRPLTPRWRPAIWATALGAVFATLHTATVPTLSSASSGAIDNPLYLSGAAARNVIDPIAQVGELLLLVGFVAGMVSIALRYRRSHGVVRQQVKWIVACALVVCVGQCITIVIGALTGHDYSSFNFVIAIIGFPIVVALAILRYRLYDIDVVIRRTLIYACLAVVLAGLYLGGIALLSAVSRVLTGQSGALAVTISTLLVAVAFQPLRRRIQGGLDRRFDRRTYDAETTVRAFTAHARDEVDLDVLCEQLVAVVETTMQPRQVSMWLRPADGA